MSFKLLGCPAVDQQDAVVAPADVAAFDDQSGYTIMFGPDQCGDTNKVHFIFRHKSPVTGEWEEKHLASAPTPTIHDHPKTHLYTAVVGTDNSVKILVDNKADKKVTNRAGETAAAMAKKANQNETLGLVEV